METASNLNDSGIALTEANRPYEAIPLFRKALIMEPDNPLLWLNLGIAQQKTGEYGEALDSFQRAANLDDTIADTWGSMGLIYYELESFESAELCYHNAIERDPDSPKIWNNLGVLYFSEGSYEEARHCFEEALSILPMYYDALYNLRDACRELQDFRAAEEFDRVLKTHKRRIEYSVPSAEVNEPEIYKNPNRESADSKASSCKSSISPHNGSSIH